jgi:methionyl-tRNA formyltransferase
MKMKQKIKIVFMGTPEFAVESLRALVEGGFDVVAVVTATDKPAGRGQKVQHSAVKDYALAQGLPILQPASLKDETFLAELQSFAADLFVVVAFRMLPEVVWAMPPLGTFNLHAALLPQYRGAAPINHAVINGETETGVTTFFITHGMDTGSVILQEKTAITPEDNAGTVHDKLMLLGAKTVLTTVKQIEAGTVSVSAQNETGRLHPAPKIFKEDCRINWAQSAEKIHNMVRGLSPYPAAFTELTLENGATIIVKVFETEYEIYSHHYQAGETIPQQPSLHNKSIAIAATDGFVYLKTLQPAGKKRMSAEDFLRGNKIMENVECKM